MTKLTIAQVESNIDNKVKQDLLTYDISYVVEKFNEFVKQANINFNLLRAAVEGEDRAISHMGVPHEPQDTAPLNPNQYDWYLNTLDNTFYMWVSGAWKKLATLASAVNLEDYYTIEEANEWFLPGTKATLKELKDVEAGVAVEDQDSKFLNIVDLADILKDQKKVDKNFLANFEDKLIWQSPTEIQYLDTTLNMETLSASIFTNGNTATYTTLISPYDRISQFQANFEATLKQELAVQYQFVSKSKAIKFNGKVGDTYKWDHIQKYEGDTTVDYIKFTGSCTLQLADNFQPGIPSTWVTQAMPYEVKLSDLITDTAKTAIVEMDFAHTLSAGSNIMQIKYLTSTYYIENRFKALLKDINQDIRDIVTNPIITPMWPEEDTSDVKLHYATYEVIDSALTGVRYFIDIKKSQADALGANGTLPVKVGRELGSIYFDVVTKLSTNAVDQALHKFRWEQIVKNCENLYLEVEKAVDFGNQGVFVFKGWREKKISLEQFHQETVTVPAANVWNDYQADLHGDNRILYITAYNANQVETNASALWKDSYIRFFDGKATAGVSTGHDRQWKLTATGIEIKEQGNLQRLKPYTDWTEFKITRMKGVGLLKGASIATNTLKADVTDAGKTLVVGSDGRIITGDASGGNRLFELARANARNNSINAPGAPIDGATSTFQYKKGVNNDYAKALHNLQIIIFDDDNQRAYSTEYSAVNKIDYSINIPIKMLKAGTLTNYDVTIEDKDLEGIAANRISVEEGAYSGIKPPFKYEVFIIDRDATLTETRGNVLYNPYVYDLSGKFNNVIATEQIDSGTRKFMIPKPAGLIGNWIFDLDRDVKVGQIVRLDIDIATNYLPQDNDIIFFGGKKVVNKGGIQIRWISIKNVFNDDLFEFKKVSDGVEEYWQWVGNPARPLAGGYDLFETKVYDYSSVKLTTTDTNTGGTHFITLTKPVGSEGTPIGTINKIAFDAPTFGVTTAEQVLYGTDIIWTDKSRTHSVDWVDIKTHIENGELMLIKRVDSKNWYITGWETKGVSPAIQSTIDGKLNLSLDNVKTTAEKTAFINGLKAIGIETGLFKEFKGVLPAEPASPNELDWYILSTDNTINVYHNSAWHKIGATTNSLDRAAILTLLGLDEADLTAVNDLPTSLAAKQDTLTTAASLTLLGLTQAQVDAVKTLTADLGNKQDTLTTTLTIEFDDGTTQDVLVG